MTQELEKPSNPWIERIRDTSLRKTAKFCREFKIASFFELAEEQMEIFVAYFAGYLAVKDTAQEGYLARKPEYRALLKIPLLNLVAKTTIAIDEAGKEVDEEFVQQAEAKSLEFLEEIRKNGYKIIAERMHVTDDYLERILPADSQTFEDVVNFIVNFLGSPGAIKRAANLLSSAYVEGEKADKDLLKRKIERILDNIKIREELNLPDS